MKNSNYLDNILNFVINIIIYSLVLLLISIFMKTIDIDTKYYGIYIVLSSIIVCFLNKTIKPVLFRVTIPITGITLGLFYPCINILILKLVDFILGSHFETQGIITLFLTAILISFMHMLMETVITKFIFRKGDRNEFSSV